jgi:hypothetical protein
LNVVVIPNVTLPRVCIRRVLRLVYIVSDFQRNCTIPTTSGARMVTKHDGPPCWRDCLHRVLQFSCFLDTFVQCPGVTKPPIYQYDISFVISRFLWCSCFLPCFRLVMATTIERSYDVQSSTTACNIQLVEKPEPNCGVTGWGTGHTEQREMLIAHARLLAY